LTKQIGGINLERKSEATMDRLMIRCSGCGDGFTLATPAVNSNKLNAYNTWGANLDLWLNHHWPHISASKPLGEAFTLEDNESMEEKA
jgi:hypothetical protein